MLRGRYFYGQTASTGEGHPPHLVGSCCQRAGFWVARVLHSHRVDAEPVRPRHRAGASAAARVPGTGGREPGGSGSGSPPPLSEEDGGGLTWRCPRPPPLPFLPFSLLPFSPSPPPPPRVSSEVVDTPPPQRPPLAIENGQVWSRPRGRLQVGTSRKYLSCINHT
jgi:hypothetical protein